MAKSRKDSRGYVLRTGESQRKDGRYSYSYTDLDKNRRTVYAKTLVELRAKERKIIRDKEDGLNPQLADRMTLNELYDRFIEQKYDLKPSTKVNYLYMYNHFVRPTFGKRLIGKIKYSDVKKFYYRIILDEEMKANTLDSIHTQLHPAFQMAVRDGLLRQNPTDGLMAEIKKSHIWEDNPRHALTIPQQKAFMDYLKAHREYQGWVPIITVLLGTGMRIGDDDDKIRLNQRKPSKYKGLSRFGPEKNLQRINKFMKERPIFYKNLIQMKENFRFYLRCFYCITKVVILQFNSENRTELARNG
ncbi:integrase DNA-binding domain-containing protein [Mediterraneibacter gnavus]|uniref:integrase DNA-binding domain-containing protein n=1 Tax=Mediterraneibacter gnavus TaxID=33038 RepID=UPI001FAD2F1E|nr:integrase DNA-binding domain-containing protein [Mediterraneibacter gnavus]MDB8721257.1 integrase DNA-binding domain-containing protein [Mediterraneibacter gnavus]